MSTAFVHAVALAIRRMGRTGLIADIVGPRARFCICRLPFISGFPESPPSFPQVKTIVHVLPLKIHVDHIRVAPRHALDKLTRPVTC